MLALSFTTEAITGLKTTPIPCDSYLLDDCT